MDENVAAVNGSETFQCFSLYCSLYFYGRTVPCLEALSYRKLSFRNISNHSIYTDCASRGL